MLTMTLYVRDVPDDLHRAFKADCVRAGVSIRERLISFMEYVSGEDQWNQEAGKRAGIVFDPPAGMGGKP